MRITKALVLLLVGVSMSSALMAQDQGESRRVRELENRIRQLEGRLATVESERRNDQLADRLETNINALAESMEFQDDPNTFRAHWKKGLNFTSGGGAFSLKIGGRIQNDWTFAGQDEDLESTLAPAGLGSRLADGTEFRRARIFISGTMYENIYFKAQYDMAGGPAEPAEFKDVYMGIKGLGDLGRIQVGHFKEPMGLEELTSSKYITFMERSYVFSPSRNTGLMAFNSAMDDRLTWAVGVFRNTGDYGQSLPPEDGKYAVTARVTGLPWHEDDGRNLLHLGASVSWRNPDGDLVRFRQRPNAHLLPRFVDTGSFDAEDELLVGLEAALVMDSFSLQGELALTHVDRLTAGVDDPTFASYYLEASYWLTGEHRRYKASKADFGRPNPNQDFMDGEGGSGAWQLAARYTNVDLNEEGIVGGELDTFDLALNWWLNPNTRITFNYVHADVEDGLLDGEAHIFMIRFQVDF